MNRGIVMGIEKRQSIVLTPDGEFRRVPSKTGVSVGDEIQLDVTSRIRKPKMLYSMGFGAAAVVLLLFVPLFMSLRTPESPVVAYLTMDINPSIEIGVDDQEKVIELRAMNGSARKLTKGIEYEGLPVEHVAETIMDRVDAAHYFDSGEGDVLIASVLVKETGKADFETLLTAHVDAAVKKSLAKNDAGSKRTVQVNTVSAPKEVRDEANEIGLSSGKMAFYLVAKSQGREVDIKKLKRTSVHKTAKPWGGVGAVLDDKKQTDALKAEQRQKEQKKKLEELLKKEKQQWEKNKEALTAKRNEKAGAQTTAGKAVTAMDPANAKNKDDKDKKDRDKDKREKEKEKKDKNTGKDKEKDWKAYKDKVGRDKTDKQKDDDEQKKSGWNKNWKHGNDDDDDDDDDRSVIQAKNSPSPTKNQEKNTNANNDSDNSGRSGGQQIGEQASGGRHPAVYPSPSDNGKSGKEDDSREQAVNKREREKQQEKQKQQEKEKQKQQEKEKQKQQEKQKQKEKEKQKQKEKEKQKQLENEKQKQQEKEKQKQREQDNKNDKERGRDGDRH